MRQGAAPATRPNWSPTPPLRWRGWAGAPNARTSTRSCAQPSLGTSAIRRRARRRILSFEQIGVVDERFGPRLINIGPDYREDILHLPVRVDADRLQVGIERAAGVIAGLGVPHQEIIDDA